MATTFAVDQVEPASAPPATVRWADVVGPHEATGLPLDLPVLSCALTQMPMMVPEAVHPLLAAVHYAFVEHRPLVLSPDAVWLTIAAGVAQHVKLHAEALRPRIVQHQGRKRIERSVLALPQGAEEWAESVQSFAAAAGEDTTALAKLLACNFSTSGPVERVAGDLILLDATSPYFDLLFVCVCGIPRLTLTGTIEDWRTIRERCQLLAEPGSGLELGFWTESLIPIADKLVEAAQGEPDAEFFRDLYKPKHAYGFEAITGWIARLYPYVRDERGTFTRRNPLLAIAVLDRQALIEAGSSSSGGYRGPGISSRDVPHTPAAVVLQVDDLPNQRSFAHDLVGGLMTIAVTSEGELEPRAGWVVRPQRTSMRSIVQRMREQHRLIERAAAPTIQELEGAHEDDWLRERVTAAAELHELYAELHEAWLFEGERTWHILPLDGKRPRLQLAQYGSIEAHRLIDLPDGSYIAMVIHPDRRAYVRARGGEPFSALEHLGDSLLEILGEAMARGGELPQPCQVPLHEVCNELLGPSSPPR